jgi:predicted transcriptional regulator YheO
MKFLFALLSVLILYGCNTRTKWKLDSKKPIVDYSTNYETNRRMLSISSAIKPQNKQTIVLINNKPSNLKKFNKLLKKEKIKDFKKIQDKKEIEQLNYSYNDVQAIIIATKK